MPPRRPRAPGGRSAETASSGLTHALIYTRVSSDEQAREGVSLADQLLTCRRYAADRGWALADEYQDVLSGTKDARPAYQALLADARVRAEAGQRVAVVVARLDRFGRRLMEQLRCREEFQRLGVAVHFVRQGGVVADLTANLLASVAQEEVRLLGERVSDTRTHLARQGWWSGSQAPWGYRLRDATAVERAQGSPRRVLELDPEAAPFVQETAARIVAGASLRSVVRWLHTLPRAARGGRRLAHSQVRAYLQNPHLRGQVAGGPARWPALLDAATGAALDARAARWTRGQQGGTGRYLLTGLLRCPQCGGPMGGAPPQPPAQARYRCYGWDARRRPNGTPCNGAAMLAPLDADVLAQVRARLAPLLRGDARRLQRRWLAQRAPGPPATVAQQQSYERAKAQAQRRLADAAVKLVDGDLDRHGYTLVREQAEADLAAAQAALATLPVVPAPGPPWPTVRALLGQWDAQLATGEVGALRPVLLELIEAVQAVRPRRGEWHAVIQWTALGAALGELEA